MELYYWKMAIINPQQQIKNTEPIGGRNIYRFFPLTSQVYLKTVVNISVLVASESE